MSGQTFTLWLNPDRAGDRRILEHLAGLPARQRSAKVKQALLQYITRAAKTVIQLENQSNDRRPSVKSVADLLAGLTPLELEVLEEIARHPFLSCRDLTRLLDTRSEREMRRRLASLRQAAALSARPVGHGRYLYVIGPAGLQILSGHWNESVASLRRRLQIGPRQFGFLQHTVEVNRFFLDLLDTARATEGHALEVWRSEGESRLIVTRGGRKRALRPDGYGVYRVGEQVYPFLLEWDRGTAVLSKYRFKFALYADYYAGLVRQSSNITVPALWVVTVNEGRVNAILNLVQSLKRRIGFDLPILVTTVRRLEMRDVTGSVWSMPHSQVTVCFYRDT
jgi:hypothetical protein